MRSYFKLDELNEMLELQRGLDEKIRENNNIPKEQNLNLEKFLAIKTEIFELANEIESFKFWKKNKGKSKQLEEACDVLHFALSLAIDNDVELVEHSQGETYNPDKYNFNELFGIMDTMVSDMHISDNYMELNSFLLILGVIVNKCGYDISNLYDAYIGKNKVNHTRQDNNY